MANFADNYTRLEDALKVMINEKMQSPNMLVMLYPADEDLNKKWDEAGHMVGIFASYGNNPSIFIIDDDCIDDERHLMNDLDAYVAAKASMIKELYGVEGNEGWELNYIDTKEGNKNEEVYLAIESQYADTVEGMLRKYNKECSDAGFKTKLKLDRKSMVIEGTFVEKDSNLFNRIKINSQNKKAHKEFREFLLSLDPYLWKLQ